MKPELYCKEFVIIRETVLSVKSIVNVECISGRQIPYSALIISIFSIAQSFICVFIAKEAREPSRPH